MASRPPVFAALALLLAPAAFAAPPFSREIRPILSENCFKCHGPDEGERKAKLRLDQPSDIDSAEIIARITSTDPDEVMPPPDSKKSLTAEEIASLKSWTEAGRPYEKHWAFVLPIRPAVPADAPYPIDHFIDQNLAAAGLTPNPEADPYTLIRRLYLDLIGLPPTPEEADAFAAAPSEAAYKKVVDHLLASTAYGERWARRWLDLARYADTNGYEKDRDRSIWPYRDWVIRALNADMPFDQFTVEQLAGDMLPDPTTDQRVATGFHRNTMLNEEGGIDPLEFRFHAMTDRVATTGTAWLGLTTGCAQCHTHKYDPITHHDYYGMMAYLNNADEPDYLIREPETLAQHQKNLTEAENLTAKLPAAAPASEESLTRWIADQRVEVTDWHPLEPTKLAANFPYLTHEGGGTIFVAGDTSKHDVFTLTFPPFDQPVSALRLEALPDDRLPDRGPGTTFYEGRKGDFYLTEFKVAGAKIASATETYANNQFGKNPVSAQLTTDGDIQTGWSVAGRVGERHVAVFVFEKPIPAGTPLEIEMHFGRHYASTLGKFRLSATSAGNPIATERDPDIDRLLSAPDENRAALKTAFLLQSPELAAQTKRIRDLQNPPGGTLTLVMQERPADHPRPTFLHHRGEFTQPKEQVTPRLPEAIFPPGKPLPKDRLEFARWLVSKENPLTARVAVNRHWAALFGTGIVKTVEDFGMQGALPTHPELLDWLAVEFMESGWSIKHLHRTIVTSAAYRRSSHMVPEQLAKDPENRLLARAPRFRLDAEIIRDSALKSAGILSEKRFGSPVRPPQPEGVTEVAWGSPNWNPSAGEDRFRRSIYTFIKRTAPFAMFTTFDASSGESCLARRDVSNTALQSLTLLNDPMFVEISQEMAVPLTKSPGDDSAKLEQAFRKILTRPPTPDELALLQPFLEKHGWPALTRALFSLDESITRN